MSTVQEYSAPENGVSTPGEFLHFVYGSNYTTITDGTDSNTEYFDNEGKLVSVIDDEGNAIFAQYKDEVVSKVSKTRNSARNINDFYNFESDSDCFFDSLSGTVNITNTEHFNGNSSVELSSPAGSNVSYENEITGLKENTTYTVSMWIKTTDSSHLSLKLSNDDSNGIFQTVSANSDYSNWELITCTMSTDESNCLVVTIKDNRSRCNANTVYVDSMYVQQSTEPTSVNLLSNNDFSEATSGWILSDSSSSVISESANISTADEYRIKLIGDYTSTNNINQTIQLGSNNYQNTKFTFGGWIRVVDAIPVKEGSERNISIKLEALKSDGTIEFSKSIPISPNNSVWQYFEDEITILSNNITSLKYSINYNYEMGYLLADGLSLSQEELYNINFNYDSTNQNISSIIVENKTIFDENQNNANNLESSTNYHYDSYGNIERTIVSASVDNISQSIVSAQTYSNNGSLLTETTNNIGYNTSYSYECFGNLAQVTDANGNTIEYQFDNLQNISGIINEFELSSDANADTSELKTKYIYSGNTLEEIQTGTVVNNVFSAVNTYCFSYDKWNNLESVYVNDNTTPFILYEYDSDKYWQLNSVSYINGQEIHYLYDDDGNIIYEHDSCDTNGDTLSYSYYYYDNGICYGKKDYILERIETYQDELTTISDFDGNVIHSYGKDLSGNVLEQINDNFIHISETTDNDEQTNLSTSSQTTTINDIESNISIITDAFGRKQTEVITIDNNSSIVKNYVYYDSNDSYESGRNQFAEDTDAIKSISYVKSVNGVTTPLYTYEYTYDKNGNVHSEKVTKGTDTQNAVTQTHTYNSANMLLSSMSSDNDKRLQYEYDCFGNMTYMQRVYCNNTDRDWLNVSYSSLESETGTKIGNVVKEFPYEDDKVTVSHDSLGNVTSLEHIILHENVFAPCDDANYYELDWTRGNVLNGISSEYKTSDGQNTTSVPRSSISYEYDDNNLRTKKIFNMADDMNYVTSGNNDVLNGYTEYYWREGLLVSEHSEFSGTNMQEDDSINNTTIDNSGEYETTVLYDQNNNSYGFILTKIERDNQNVITNEISELYYYIKDANNTITSITDESGNTVLSYDYNMYGDFSGNYKAATGYKYLAIVSPLTYRDYIYDYESGLYYLQSRYYAPFVGRFISADNVLDTCSGTSMSTNLYSYCENDPINNTDPYGYMKKHWYNKVSNVAKAIDVAIIVISTGKSIVGIKALRAFIKANRKRLIKTVEAELLKLIGTSVSALLPAAFDIALTLLGTSIGELIAKGIDYVDPLWKKGYIRNNGYILN
ncbi:MAG: RHS repeat-associated core domain-containing protein [Eubacterium sp.]|nr:RHS repeat-associated core domain-containing protein [Eubacterium sp.]